MDAGQRVRQTSGMKMERGPVGGMEEQELRAIFERTYGPVKNRGMEALAQSRRTTARPGLDDAAYVHKDDVLIVTATTFFLPGKI